MLKNKRLAYDGRGNAVVNEPSEVERAFLKLGGKDVYAERWMRFSKELAVMVVSASSFLQSTGTDHMIIGEDCEWSGELPCGGDHSEELHMRRGRSPGSDPDDMPRRRDGGGAKRDIEL